MPRAKATVEDDLTTPEDESLAAPEEEVPPTEEEMPPTEEPAEEEAPADEPNPVQPVATLEEAVYGKPAEEGAEGDADAEPES